MQMKKIDKREIIWYDIMKIVNFDPESMPHYWSTLISKFRLIDNMKEYSLCWSCLDFDLFQNCNGELYCLNRYEPVYGEKDGEEVIIGAKDINRPVGNINMKHTIVSKTLTEAIDCVLAKLFDMLEEPSGNRYTLFDLESIIFMRPLDEYFETKEYGIVTKQAIIQYLYKIKELILRMLHMIKDEITFSNVTVQQVT